MGYRSGSIAISRDMRPLRFSLSVCNNFVANVTLPALQTAFVEFFFGFAWECCIEKWGGFLVKFFWSPFPMKRSMKAPQKRRGKSGAKFGAKFRTTIRKFGQLSFCNFSDLSPMVLCNNFLEMAKMCLANAS